MVKCVLLKDTSAATDQAGIRTHILTTPELESNAPDRSAATLPDMASSGFEWKHMIFYSVSITAETTAPSLNLIIQHSTTTGLCPSWTLSRPLCWLCEVVPWTMFQA